MNPARLLGHRVAARVRIGRHGAALEVLGRVVDAEAASYARVTRAHVEAYLAAHGWARDPAWDEATYPAFEGWARDGVRTSCITAAAWRGWPWGTTAALTPTAVAYDTSAYPLVARLAAAEDRAPLRVLVDLLLEDVPCSLPGCQLAPTPDARCAWCVALAACRPGGGR